MSNTETTSEKLNDDGPEIVAHAQEYLKGILDRMGIDATIEVGEQDDKILLTVDCDNVEQVIGRRGQVVDALQHLVGKMVAQHREGRGKPIIVDAGDYRQKHVERLESLARRMGEKAADSNESVSLSPMSAYDRRIIHMTLAEVDGVSTQSEGEGDRRHVVVVPDGADA